MLIWLILNFGIAAKQAKRNQDRKFSYTMPENSDNWNDWSNIKRENLFTPTRMIMEGICDSDFASYTWEVQKEMTLELMYYYSHGNWRTAAVDEPPNLMTSSCIRLLSKLLHKAPKDDQFGLALINNFEFNKSYMHYTHSFCFLLSRQEHNPFIKEQIDYFRRHYTNNELYEVLVKYPIKFTPELIFNLNFLNKFWICDLIRVSFNCVKYKYHYLSEIVHVQITNIGNLNIGPKLRMLESSLNQHLYSTVDLVITNTYLQPFTPMCSK